VEKKDNERNPEIVIKANTCPLRTDGLVQQATVNANIQPAGRQI